MGAQNNCLPQNLELFGHVVIPGQHTLNAALTFRRHQWELR